jgi:hypothetical protein
MLLRDAALSGEWDSGYELANACRRAYLRLVTGAYVGWGKLELAEWLTGPYRELTVAEEWLEAPPSLAIGNDTAPASVLDQRVATVLQAMRTDVLVVMNELMTPEGVSAFTKLAFDTGLVAQGGFSVVPRARPRMTLVDRALSLIAVDAITRPEDYEHSLFLCERCKQPVFDVLSRERGVCRTHVSGISTL